MSTVIVKFKPELEETIIKPFREQLKQEIIDISAKILNKKPADIIVDFEPWGNPAPQNAPDILLRAETSLARRHLLRPWGEAMLEVVRKIANSSNNKDLRLAVKPYVIDSEWIEVKQ